MIFVASTLCILLVSVTGPVQASRPAGNVVQMSIPRCSGGRFYSGLGCFSGRPPFNNSNWLPQSPDVVGTTFFLYTRQNPYTAQILDPTNRASIRRSHYDNSLPVKVLIHGFLQNAQFEFLNVTTQALLRIAPMNVIVVGWGSGATLPYSQAVANTRIVGAEIARLLLVMRQTSNLSLDTVHLIGHSLGAHVAGYVGSRLRDVARITALDPAEPNFSGYPPEVRLDPSDARFVDVIHTDGEPYATVRGYGMMEPVGHVDFYPNGGLEQPGCVEDSSVLDFVSDAFSQGLTRAEYDVSCSHERSTELFIAALQLHDGPCTFKAFPCESAEKFLRGECQDCRNRPCPEMGLHANTAHGARGSFYLNTTGAHPFCGYHHFVSVDLPSNEDLQGGILLAKLYGGRNGTTPSEWVPLTRDALTPHNKHIGLVITPEDLDEITRVEVNFRSSASYITRWMSFSGHQVTLDKVEVNCPMRRPRKYFCQPGITVDHDHPVTLTSGTHNPNSCPEVAGRAP